MTRLSAILDRHSPALSVLLGIALAIAIVVGGLAIRAICGVIARMVE